MRGLIIGVLMVAVLAVLAFLLVNNSKKENTDPIQTTIDSSSSKATGTTANNTSSGDKTNSLNEAVSSVTISYTESGFVPESSVLKSGGSVTWVNNTDSQLQVGVNPHPSHTGDKALTDGEFVLILGKGESKVVTISKSGSFGYHNHLSPGDTGTLTVK